MNKLIKSLIIAIGMFLAVQPSMHADFVGRAVWGSIIGAQLTALVGAGLTLAYCVGAPLSKTEIMAGLGLAFMAGLLNGATVGYDWLVAGNRHIKERAQRG